MKKKKGYIMGFKYYYPKVRGENLKKRVRSLLNCLLRAHTAVTVIKGRKIIVYIRTYNYSRQLNKTCYNAIE